MLRLKRVTRTRPRVPAMPGEILRNSPRAIALPPNTRTGGRPRGVPLGWLVQNFRDIPPNASHETRMKHLFAYLLYIFGTMFPSSHGDIVFPV